MTSAIFGLVGVVLGALLAGGIGYALQRRIERREARTAARLVAGEMAKALDGLSRFRAYARTPELGLSDTVMTLLPIHAWEEHREALASTTDDATWTMLANFHYSLALRRTQFTALGVDSAISLDDVVALRELIIAGHDAISRLGQAPPPLDDLLVWGDQTQKSMAEFLATHQLRHADEAAGATRGVEPHA